MDELIIVFLLIILLLVFIIIPIIILVQINSLKSEIRLLNRKINDLLMPKTTQTPRVAPEMRVAPEERVTNIPPKVPPNDIKVEEEKKPYDRRAYMPPQQVDPALEKTPALHFPKEDIIPEIVPDMVNVPLPILPPQADPAALSAATPVSSSVTATPVPPSAAATPATPSVTAPPSPPMPASPPSSMYERANTGHPSISKSTDERSFFEKFLGTNWLSKVGIVTLVLGIGFFVKYAIDQEWINEIGRVGIGLFTGGLLIAIAHKLKAKYSVFSSILVGGGISVFYITITLAFREYMLFSQTAAFIMLIVITIFSVLLSLLYDRKELLIFSLLGGFAAPLMVSTGTGNYIVLFSYILILNTGMLVVAFIKKWRVIGIISYVLSLIFFWSWTLASYENQFLNVSIFISLFFVQFYLLALIDHFKSGNKISVYQVFLILTNNLSAFAAYLYVIDEYSSDIRGLITIVLAAVNAVVMMTLFKKKSSIDLNLVYLIIAIVLSFTSLAIPIQLKGHVITMFWAAESVILLWLWQKSQIKVFYAGFMLISLATLFSYCMDINNLYSYDNALRVMSNRWFITGLVVLASFVVNMILLKREPTSLVKGIQPVVIFKVLIIALAYIVPFLEIDVQLRYHLTGESFRYVALAVFTTVYVAVMGLIYSKKVISKKYIFNLLYATVCLFAVCYTFLIANLRSDIFEYGELYNLKVYFSIHLLSFLAIGYIIYLLVKNIKTYTKESTWLSWVLTILAVIILSVETDNIVAWMFAKPYMDSNYSKLMYDVRTFGYPILWGVIAMALMIWGLSKKEALLRQISLVFFGLIIVKFYAYDVWKMSQTGRIISFVMLGVILLLVSFLQQKIRTLVKNDDKTEIGGDL